MFTKNSKCISLYEEKDERHELVRRLGPVYSNLTQINIPKLDRSQVLIAIKLLQSRKFFQSGKNIKIVLL